MKLVVCEVCGGKGSTVNEGVLTFCDACQGLGKVEDTTECVGFRALVR